MCNYMLQRWEVYPLVKQLSHASTGTLWTPSLSDVEQKITASRWVRNILSPYLKWISIVSSTHRFLIHGPSKSFKWRVPMKVRSLSLDFPPMAGGSWQEVKTASWRWAILSPLSRIASLRLLIDKAFGACSKQIWDLTKGEVVYTFNNHEAPLQSICFHPTEFVLGKSM